MQIIRFFLRLFEGWNGIFVKNNTISRDLKPLYETMINSRFIGLSKDRQSLNSDYHKVKHDFKKSMQTYKNG